MALVVLVFLWTRAVAGTLAAVIAALLLALDPEHLNVSQLIRFYSWHCLLFWLGAVGTYRLGTSPPPTLGGSMLLAMGVVVCFAAALYLQLTTLIGLLGVAIGGAVALGLPWLAKSSHRTRWGVAVGVALLGAVAISALIKTGLAGQLLDRYRSTPLFGAENRDAFWYYHSYLIIYYPTLWSLLAPAVVIGLAYRPRPTAFCACLVAVAFVAHSFAGPKGMRYFTYALPFLFVLVGHRARGGLDAVASVLGRGQRSRSGVAWPRPARRTWHVRPACHGPRVHYCGQWGVAANRRERVRFRHPANEKAAGLGSR